MNFIIKKVSNYGVQHPVVARLAVQTTELIQWASIPKESKDEISDLYINKLKPRLLKCHEILERLKKGLSESCAEIGQQEVNERVQQIPHVAGLEGEVESFAYEVKNYLRDLLALFRIFFSCKCHEASAWYSQTGPEDSSLAKWAVREFGAKDKLTELLLSERPWCEEWIRIRNALEHPGGKSGTVTIHNVRPFRDGLLPPTWSRDGKPESDIFTDMSTGLHNMLTMAEEVLVVSIEKRKAFNNIAFYEIAENDRNPNIPQRIRVGLASGVAEPRA